MRSFSGYPRRGPRMGAGSYHIPGLAVRGGGLDASAAALIARMTSAPSGVRAAQINKLVRDLKLAGIWPKLDVLYVLAAHDAQAARLNWKSSSFTLTAVNSPTFTTDRGYAGDGSTSYLDTGFNPSTASGQFALNSATLCSWLVSGTTTASTSVTAIGSNDATNFAYQQPYRSSGVGARINATSSFDIGTVATRLGLTAITRSASNVNTGYRNGASLGTSSIASAALPNANMFVCGRNNAGSLTDGMTNVVGAVFAGASLNGTEHAALYTALNTYLTAVGAA